MGRKFLAISGIWLLACAVLAAADFWEEKELTSWSDKDVEFITKVGDKTIKKKFRLEDMVFNDQLELWSTDSPGQPPPDPQAEGGRPSGGR